MILPRRPRTRTRSMQAMLGLCLSLLPGASLPAAPYAGSLPAGVRVLSVFSGARLGEQPLSGVQVHSERSPADLLQLFEQHWQQSGSQPIWRDQVAGWSVLSRALRFPIIEVLQVRPDGAGRSLAYLSQADVTAVAAAQDRERSAPWLPGAFKLLQSFFSRDPARVNTTFLAATSLSLGPAFELMSVRLREQGLQARSMPTGAAHLGSDVVAMFTRPGIEVVMTLHAQAGRTLLVMHVSVGQDAAQRPPAPEAEGRAR